MVHPFSSLPPTIVQSCWLSTGGRNLPSAKRSCSRRLRTRGEGMYVNSSSYTYVCDHPSIKFCIPLTCNIAVPSAVTHPVATSELVICPSGEIPRPNHPRVFTRTRGHIHSAISGPVGPVQLVLAADEDLGILIASEVLRVAVTSEE